MIGKDLRIMATGSEQWVRNISLLTLAHLSRGGWRRKLGEEKSQRSPLQTHTFKISEGIWESDRQKAQMGKKQLLQLELIHSPRECVFAL